MRLLQLNPSGNESAALDFHPMVTVVKGLSESGRRRIINAVAALPRGGNPGCAGLIEAHGILLDLDEPTLAMLDLEGDLDVIIAADDLPGGTSSTGTGVGVGADGDGASGGAPAPEPVVASSLPASVDALTIERFIAVTPRGVHRDLDAARDRQAQSAEALNLLREAAEKAREAYREAGIRRQRAEAALDRAQIADAAPNLRLVTDEFEPEGDTGAAGEAEVAHALNPNEQRARRTELEGRTAELQGEIKRIDRGIEELAALDPRPVQVLVDAIRNPAPVEYVPSERGHELADEFVRLQGEVNVLEEGLAARGMDTPSAMARLDAARAELATAEKGMRPPEFTDQDRIDLEAAHDEVMEAEKKSRGRGKKRFDDALAKEQKILDRMGFPTWSSYVMGSSLMGIDPAAEGKLEKARFELEAAEQHWSNVTAMIEADPVHRQLLDRLEALYLEAFDLLGGDDDESEDLETKLRSLQEAKREVSMDELVDALAYQLEVVGITLPPAMADLDRTVMVAEAFLEEAGAIADRLNELGDEKVAALTELDEIDDELATLLSFEQLDESEAKLAEAAAAGAEALAQIEREQEEERAAAAQVEVDLAEVEHEHEVAAEEEGEYADLLEAREALLDAAIQVESVATTRLNKLAAELAAAEAGESGAPAAEPAPGSTSPLYAAPDPIRAETDAAFADTSGVDASPEAVEFFLLARLAALRTVSFAGSVPLLIDDALTALSRKDVEQLLHKLERMSESVQIIYLSDDEAVNRWADDIGFERAAVVAAPSSFA